MRLRHRRCRLDASPEKKRAICNDTAVPTLGRIELRRVTTASRDQILTGDKLRAGHVEVTASTSSKLDSSVKNCQRGLDARRGI